MARATSRDFTIYPLQHGTILACTILRPRGVMQYEPSYEGEPAAACFASSHRAIVREMLAKLRLRLSQQRRAE